MVASRVCPQCGNTFSPKKSSITFCSHACWAASVRKPRPTLVCAHCSRTFQVDFAYQATTQRFCSHACYLASHRPAKICQQCGNTYTGRNQRYCSAECVHASQRTRVVRTCGHCDRPFEVAPNVLHRGQGLFCSQRCARDNQKAQRVTLVCQHCGAAFEVIPSQLAWRNPRFCSLNCHRKHSPATLPETMVREALVALGIPFEREHPIGRYSIDFFLPDSLTAIEVDGTFWHRRKGSTDTTRDIRLAALGIRTVRIPESDVMDGGDVATLLAEKLAGTI